MACSEDGSLANMQITTPIKVPGRNGQELVCQGADVGNKEQNKVRTHLRRSNDFVEESLCKQILGFV